MNIVLRELRSNLKSLIIWSGCMATLILIMMMEFEAYYDNPEMAGLLDAMPQALMKAFSIAGPNLTTLIGFVSIASVYFYIMLGIFAVLLGSSIISKEERDKTAEFFLTLPISRTRAISAKLIAAVINCLLLTGVTAAALYSSAAPYNPDQEFLRFFRLLMSALFIIQMIFLSTGMCTAAVIKHYKKSGNYSVYTLLTAYIISVVISMDNKIDFLKYFTPFKYFEAQYIAASGELELKYLIISAVIIIAGFTGTYLIYPKRDLYI
ncbi:MAG: ABC transporter permease subunit [Spirochaetales bacterium]|uniref:ABC transporter permease subunit n=1 Tax=Candidatus Thalassospirochaeta sargassi TaxID=3119039 RepID=A0AAJ1MJQ8_9SPIO|nr:ABC transporter permease subunit [Spirochaetales bacterium]